MSSRRPRFASLEWALALGLTLGCSADGGGASRPSAPDMPGGQSTGNPTQSAPLADNRPVEHGASSAQLPNTLVPDSAEQVAARASAASPVDGPSTGGTGSATGNEDVDERSVETGGAAATPHPLFGSGNYTAADFTDPCDTATIWKADTAIDLDTGSLVIYLTDLWELTGTINESWALPDCTPPGTGWCAEQYAWKLVGSCPAAVE